MLFCVMNGFWKRIVMVHFRLISGLFPGKEGGTDKRNVIRCLSDEALSRYSLFKKQ